MKLIKSFEEQGPKNGDKRYRFTLAFYSLDPEP